MEPRQSLHSTWVLDFMKPVDIVVLILAIPVAVIVLASAILPSATGRIISESKAEMLASVVEDIIKLLYAYVGFKFGETRK